MLVRSLLLVAFVAPLLTGCLAEDDGSAPVARLTPASIPRIDAEHDHLDPTLHPEIALGLRVVNQVRFDEGPFADAGVLDVGNAGRMVLHEDLLLIATIRTGRAGFSVLDVTDPRAPVHLATYRSALGNSEGEALAVSADGAYAFTTTETFFNPATSPTPPTIEVVDLSDPANPTLAARVPVSWQPHVLTFFEAGGSGYLVASEYQVHLAAPAVLGPEQTATSSRLTLYRFEAGVPTLVEVGRFTFPPTEIEEDIFFAHDPRVLEHPVTGERVVYFGAFGGGGRIVSLADPTLPTQVGHTLEKGAAPVLRHHSFEPYAGAIDGIVPAAAVPRSGQSDGPGSAYLTLYDTADPTAPTLLGQWRHPDTDFLPGDFPPLNLHIPAWRADGARLIVPHFHAGLFVFDTSSREAMTAPAPVAFFAPGAVPDEGARAASVVAAAQFVGDVILAADTGSGTLYALELTG